MEYITRDPRHQETSALRGPTARPPRKMNGHSLPFGTWYPTQFTARGPRSSPGSASPGTRRECSTRQFRTTTSRPVTRISRRTGDSLPTPHSRAWYEARRSCPIEPYLHRMRPDPPASQETRIRLPRQDTTRMSGDGGPGTPVSDILNSTTSCQPPAPARPGAGRIDPKSAKRKSK